jgi:hypothetical protein
MTHRTAKVKPIYMLQSTVTDLHGQLRSRRNFTLRALQIWQKIQERVATSHHHNRNHSHKGEILISQHLLAMAVGTSS